ncbi:MAG: metallopeptidase TldD-related protein [Cyanobacteria bacterium J06598_1]
MSLQESESRQFGSAESANSEHARQSDSLSDNRVEHRIEKSGPQSERIQSEPLSEPLFEAQSEPTYEKTFHQIVEAIQRQLAHQPQLHFRVSLSGEESQFTRFNQSKVRQTGEVRDGQIRLTLIATAKDADEGESREPQNKTVAATLPFVGSFATDWVSIQSAIAELQKDLHHLPIDPYAVLPTIPVKPPTPSAQNPSCQAHPTQNHRSREVHTGQLLTIAALPEAILSPVQSLDFSGLYAGGRSYRAYADSTGKHHWFETPTFTLDYSLFGQQPNEAVKGTIAGQQWHPASYAQSIKLAQQQLSLCARPVKQVPRGRYRTYLAPAAVADIIDTVAWGGGLGEASLRQGNSAFSRLENGEVALSKKFSLGEDFQRVGLPRFNHDGEVAPAQLPVIEQGQWANALVNGRSAKEYGKRSNGANREEAIQAPLVAPGTLKTADILTQLWTGLYVSNVHYLNWSDLTAGRMTGMTRYACFWVEEGEMVAPIENLRFDDDLYRFLGEGLIDLTEQQTFIPAVGTYDRRSLGGMWVPGMLIEDFRYTL